MSDHNDKIYCCQCSCPLDEHYFFSGYDFFCDDCTPEIINTVFASPQAFTMEQIQRICEDLPRRTSERRIP
jgi:hypothetical protein